MAFGQVGAPQGLESQQGGGDPVARGGEAEIHDVSRLFAAEGPASLAQRLQDVAVADLGSGDPDARLAHRGVEAVVRHHRDRHPVPLETTGLAEMDRSERDQFVAVDYMPSSVRGEHSVGVAVEGKTEVVPALRHGGGERVDVGRADAVVDVASVGVDADRPDLRTQATEDLRRGAVGGPVRAVEQDVHAAQVEGVEPGVQLAQVVLERAVEVADTPHRAAGGRALLEQRLDLLLRLVRQLVAVGAEELDPVVVEGIVRGGQHHAEVEPVAAHEQRRGRGGQNTSQQGGSARLGDAGRSGRLEHVAGLARVPQDEDLWPPPTRRRPADRGGGERQGELGGDVLARDPAHAVGAEEATGQRVTAWRTAGACAPSSGRPSCAP